MSRGLVAAAAIVALAAGAVAAADRVGAQAGVAAPVQTLPLTASAEVPVCPGPETRTVPEGAAAIPAPGPVTVAAVSVPAGAVAAAAVTGNAELAVALGPVTAETRPGAGAVTGTGRPGQAAVVTAAPKDAGALRTFSPGGGPVPAVAAAQWTLARDGDLRGLVTAGCPVAGTQTWLIGGGTVAGRRGRLLLTNPSAAPAVADVTVYGSDGIVQAPAGTGVVIAPGEEKALFVDALAPGLGAVAVRVQARSGRVAAVLHDSVLRGTTPGGADDITAAADPARRQFVPGIAVATAGNSTPRDATAAGATAVRVLVPGGDEAVVRVHLLGPDGEFELPGGGVVTVAPHGVADVPLVGVPDGVYTAVVESDTPVVSGAVVGRFATPVAPSRTPKPGGTEAAPGDATAEATGDPGDGGTGVGPDGAPEFGWAAAARPLGTVTALAVPGATGPDRTGATVRLALASTGGTGRVGVAGITEDGTVQQTREVEVAGGRTVLVAVPAGTAGLVLQPDGQAAPVVGALIVTVADPAGELVSVGSVRPGVVAGRVPPRIAEDPRAGLTPDVS